jgi:hypothetical protein
LIDHDVASYGHIAKLFVDGEPYGDLTSNDEFPVRGPRDPESTVPGD